MTLEEKKKHEKYIYVESKNAYPWTATLFHMTNPIVKVDEPIRK